MKKTVSKITITNVNNIDFKQLCVIDNSKVEERKHDSNMDVFTFENIKTNQKRKANLMSVSLYDDVLIEGDQKYKILAMLTKDEEVGDVEERC